MQFPEGFRWGVASSAYQIEGAAAEDGRGPSIWDAFCQRDGAVFSGHSGDVACDHYHRYASDIELMQALGVNAYRFSIAWSRVLPDGVGEINRPGLAFYDRLVDTLLAANIAPFVTLYHWDLPLALDERGGWLNRDSAAWFAEYAHAVVERLSDRVQYWMTFNEVQVFLNHGYRDGIHAPGEQRPMREVLTAGHNVLRAHGQATRVIRAHSKTHDPQVGFAPVGVAYMPASDAPGDVEAARLATAGVTADDVFNNAWWLDPLFHGHYPEVGVETYGADCPQAAGGDFAEMQAPPDFLGLNIYFGQPVRAGDNGRAEEVPFPPGHPTSPMDEFTLSPSSLYWGPKLIGERYGVPIYITENGTSSRDRVFLDGHVHDVQRIDYLTRYLTELRRAVADGVDVRGYFHWSIMDNFEWALGYKERFGLHYVDFTTLERTPKDSARWYRDVIATNGARLDQPPFKITV